MVLYRLFACAIGLFLVSCPFAAASDNAPLSQWPDPPNPKVSTPVLAYESATPYNNTNGALWVSRINGWYQAGTAAGLTQDTWRSYDGGHAWITPEAFPQLTCQQPTGDFQWNPIEGIFDLRVTWGNQSYGGTSATFNSELMNMVHHCYAGMAPDSYPALYQSLYENNFMLFAPATDSAPTIDQDEFCFLVPYYINSLGISHSDCTLMKPFIWAGAALPPALKTKILRRGLYMPVIMYLYKQSLTGDIKSPSSHRGVYTSPAEAASGSQPTPILDRLLNTANGLQHIPPVAKFTVESVTFQTWAGYSYTAPGFYNVTPYNLIACLRMGETVVIVLNISGIVDDGQSIVSYYAAKLRGNGIVESLNPEGSRIRITVPWMYTAKNYDFRTDILLLVNDGTYYSAPAYVSICHIQSSQTWMFGIPGYPAYVDPVKAYVFYNNSCFDGNNPAANAGDDNAIAVDKQPLQPGGTATFANYTSYARGINGVMLDIQPTGGQTIAPTSADIVCKIGNNNTPDNWIVRKPTITVRPSAGVSGWTRVTLTYSDGAITNTWLQVTAKEGSGTGLTQDHVFYFGNAVGETGNSSASARVDSVDVTAVRQDPHKTFANPATLTNRCDFNRDGRVNSADEVIARSNMTSVLNEVQLITVP